MELVRYIHLNPLMAGLVDSLMALHDYQWCGHSAIMAGQTNEFQDREYVLKWFGQKEGEALKENVRPTALRAGSRKQPLPKIRKQLTAKFVGEYGLSLAETARQLGISTSAVAQIIRRDRKV